MLRALRHLIGLVGPGEQFSLELDAAPRDAKELGDRLNALGLHRRYRCRLTSNRTVFVSFSADEVRIHRGFLKADNDVLKAIVRFVQARSRTDRNLARRILLSFPIEQENLSGQRPRKAPERTDPEGEVMAERLRSAHSKYNREKFEGLLGTPPIRVSRRMKSRLGHYTHRLPDGDGGEIAISLQHIKRHGWNEAMDTLIHEMIHQWQDETGLPIDHGRVFRAKARAVGISSTARRDVG